MRCELCSIGLGDVVWLRCPAARERQLDQPLEPLAQLSDASPGRARARRPSKHQCHEEQEQGIDHWDDARAFHRRSLMARLAASLRAAFRLLRRLWCIVAVVAAPVTFVHCLCCHSDVSIFVVSTVVLTSVLFPARCGADALHCLLLLLLLLLLLPLLPLLPLLFLLPVFLLPQPLLALPLLPVRLLPLRLLPIAASPPLASPPSSSPPSSSPPSSRASPPLLSSCRPRFCLLAPAPMPC